MFNKRKLIAISSIIGIIIFIVMFFFISAKKEERLHYNELASQIDSKIVPNLKYYIDYKLDGQYESELIIECEEEFDNLTNQQQFDYLKSCLIFCDIYDSYRNKMNYPITRETLGRVTVKTLKNDYSMSSVGYFSKNGVTDYELTEKNDTSEQNVGHNYLLVRGVNGQYEYRCTKICSEECGNACKTCLMNGKSFKHSPKCCFDYSAPREIGWIGCPDCGDVSHEDWYDWYGRALGLN